MKFFKTSTEPETAADGYTVLLSDLRQTTAELHNAYTNLENVIDEEIIDCLIYELNATQIRYKVILNQVRQL